MPSSLTIRHAQLVLPDRVAQGDLVIENGIISYVGPSASKTAGEIIDGTGLTVLPGVIDPQVHFRDPGFPEKENIASGSRAAAAGGVTSFLDMPNNRPATITVDALHAKLETARQTSAVHYGFFMGATADNLDEVNATDRTCGIKIFMGSSTGNLLVEDPEVLEEIFANANKLIAVHAEDEARLRQRKLLYEDSVDPSDHPKMRDVETALAATKLATSLSLKYGRRLHILHLTSAEEADYLANIPREKISCEVCPQHLLFSSETIYDKIGNLAKCNPPIRTERHATTLWKRLLDGTIDCIATDHAPHTLEEKARPFLQAPAGMPGVEWSLPLMLNRVHEGRATLQNVAAWMSENPARCYSIPRKGRLEEGYDGDIVLVDMKQQRTIEDEGTFSRCGWTPYRGETITGWPVLTALLGRAVFRDGQIIEGVRGRELTFSHK